jgi:hypothetical protein
MNKKIDYERYGPALLSTIVIFLSLIFIPNRINIPKNFDNFITYIITFVSIILGFLGVTLTILLSIRNSELIEFIFKTVNRERLKKYFIKPIIWGFFTIVITISLYFFDIYKDYVLIKNFSIGKCVLTLWVSLIMYFIFSSYRIIDIVMLIVFKNPNETEKRLQSKKLDPERERELQNKYRM